MWHEKLRRAEVFIFGVCDFDYITENWYFDKCKKVLIYDKCNCHFYKHHKCQLTFILQINQMARYQIVLLLYDLAFQTAFVI